MTAVEVARAIEASLPDSTDAQAWALGSVAAGCARILAGEDGSRQIRDGLSRLRTVDFGRGEPALTTWAVIGPLFLRDSGTGREQLERAVSDRRARSAVGELPHLLFHIARDEAASDRWDGAEADYAEAIGLARELGQSTELACALAGLAWLDARRGRVAAATRRCRRGPRAVRTTPRARDGDLVPAGHGRRRVRPRRGRAGAGSLSGSGQPTHRARHCATSTCPRRRRSSSVWSGSTDRTRPSTSPPSTPRGPRSKGQPWALARAARAQALLADDSDLDAAFGLALDHHDATLDLYERARTQLAYGGRLRRARRRIDARAVLQPALDTFVRLGAQPWADAAADELAASGATVARPDESPVSRLTPRELQIARLLTEGRTTREAAGALFLSPKTVEYHLRNIYTKLGIASRAQLADQLERH